MNAIFDLESVRVRRGPRTGHVPEVLANVGGVVSWYHAQQIAEYVANQFNGRVVVTYNGAKQELTLTCFVIAHFVVDAVAKVAAALGPQGLKGAPLIKVA